MEDCSNRLIGRCENIINGGKCKRDYENHYPNNRDCPNYHKAIIFERTLVKLNFFDKAYIEIGKIFGKNGELSNKILEKRVKKLEEKHALDRKI